MSEPDKKVQLSDFACTCGKPHDRSRRHIDAVADWADETFHLFEDGYEDYYVTRILHRLKDYGAFVDHIGRDMWGGMAIESPEVHLYMQFDRFEDGLLLALRRFWKFYGREETRDDWLKKYKRDT